MIHPKPMMELSVSVTRTATSIPAAPYWLPRTAVRGPAEPLQTEDEQDCRGEVAERGPIVGHEPSPSVSD